MLQEFKEERDPLSAVIDYWLRGNATESISWKSIVTALQSKHVGESGLAEQIRAEHCQQEGTKAEKGSITSVDKPHTIQFYVLYSL